MLNPATVTASLRIKAHELGFSHFGVAKAEALNDEGALLDEWLRRGYNADMLWMARNADKRKDPRNIVEDAQSVVVVAWNYFTDHRHETSPEKGKISRYAWGDDYHDIVTPKVRELERFLTEMFDGSVSRSFVDTGPVMEKQWAARAGIGWVGKHSNLITKDFGSWVFLGVIISTTKLEYNVPIDDFCGSCTACIDACPTDAIIDPYVVDSCKCIPYLTIECKENEIPATHAMNFESWVFGCDICQDVCPWNRFQQETTDMRFAPRDYAPVMPLLEILAMQEEQFREKFRKSPIKRTKLRGLKRNARIVRDQNESNNQ